MVAASFSSVNYLICVFYGLVVPESWCLHGSLVHSHLQPVQEAVGGGVTRKALHEVAKGRVEKTPGERRPSTST